MARQSITLFMGLPTSLVEKNGSSARAKVASFMAEPVSAIDRRIRGRKQSSRWSAEPLTCRGQHRIARIYAEAISSWLESAFARGRFGATSIISLICGPNILVTRSVIPINKSPTLMACNWSGWRRAKAKRRWTSFPARSVDCNAPSISRCSRSSRRPRRRSQTVRLFDDRFLIKSRVARPEHCLHRSFGVWHVRSIRTIQLMRAAESFVRVADFGSSSPQFRCPPIKGDNNPFQIANIDSGWQYLDQVLRNPVQILSRTVDRGAFHHSSWHLPG
jgi:hypothetical protein